MNTLQERLRCQFGDNYNAHMRASSPVDARKIKREAADRLDELEREVKALRADAERVNWLEASADHHGFCHAGNGEYRFYAHCRSGYPTVREVIDAARSKT